MRSQIQIERIKKLDKILHKYGTSIEKLKRRLASKARLQTNDEVNAPGVLVVTVFFDDYDKKLIFKTSYDDYIPDAYYKITPQQFKFDFRTYLHKETTLKRLMNGEVGYFLSEFIIFLNDLYDWLMTYHIREN